MIVMGYRITERTKSIAKQAIRAQRRSFSALHIAREILPHIRENKNVWKGMTVKDAALGAAESLIWDEYRAGVVKPTGKWLRRQYWRVIESDSKRSSR